VKFREWLEANFKNVNQAVPYMTLSYVTVSKLYKGGSVSMESAKIVLEKTLGEVSMEDIPIGKSRGNPNGRRRILT